MENEPCIGMQLLTPRRLQESLEKDPDQWIPVRLGDGNLAYGCGECGKPLVVGMSIHMINRGLTIDGVETHGAVIRCSGCGVNNSTTLKVIRYLDPSEVFLYTMADLRNRSGPSASTYDSLMAAGLVRKLLLDKPSLRDSVNRVYMLPKLRFRVNAIPELISRNIGINDIYVFDDLDPATATYQDIQDSNLDKFLATMVMDFAGISVSVHRLVDYVCHIEGGVHVMQPKDEFEIALVERRNLIIIDDKPFWSVAMPAIGRVVVEALLPLEAAVRSDHPELAQI